MSEKEELSKELIDKVEKHDLSHVETQSKKSDIILKFKCATGEEEQDFPTCPDHETQFVFEEGSTVMKCDAEGCVQTANVPECHGEVMKPFITHV